MVLRHSHQTQGFLFLILNPSQYEDVIEMDDEDDDLFIPVETSAISGEIGCKIRSQHEEHFSGVMEAVQN